MSYSTLKLEHASAISTIVLARPERRNAISRLMMHELVDALEKARAAGARAVILTGAGKAFCAGMDLEDLRSIATQPFEQHMDDARKMAEFFYAIYSYPLPLIAAVNGAAIAGGTGIATLADFTLAVPGAQFGYTEVRIGFLPAVVSIFLRRQVGDKRARDLLLSARIFHSEEAHAMGLVTRIVPAEILLAHARELAESLAGWSPTSMANTKRLLRQFQETEIRRELDMAVRESAEIRETADFREGLSAFLEKRTPQWSKGPSGEGQP
jgi:methylglutaconyl-CoA hydratase